MTEGEPHNSEAEALVVGACMIWPEDFPKGLVILKPEHFYGSHARMSWQIMTTLWERGQRPDAAMVAFEAGDKAGPNFRQWLAASLDGVPRLNNLEEWCQIIRDKAARRALARRCSALLKAVNDEANTTDWLYDQMSTADSQLRGDTSFGVVSAESLVNEALRRLEEYSQKKDGVQGLRTGMEGLDHYSWGMKEGQLILLAGRPARGKSVLTAQIARAAVRQDARTLIFPMEMSPRSVVERGLLSEGAVRKRDLLPWNDQESRETAWGQLAKAAGELAGMPLWFDKGECPTVSQMAATAQIQKQRHGLDLIVVDYVQRMSLPPRSESRTYGIGENIQRLKSLAMRLKVPILAAYQLDSVDESQEKRPTPANFAQCKQVAEAEADQIWFLHPVDPRGFNESTQVAMEIIVDKNREGPTGVAKAIFDRERLRFYEVPDL